MRSPLNAGDELRGIHPGYETEAIHHSKNWISVAPYYGVLSFINFLTKCSIILK